MIEVPKFSPGCFGSALTFNSGDMICRTCSFAALCEPAHVIARAELRKMFGIVTKERAPRTPKVDVSVEDPARLSLSTKVQDILNRIDRGNFDIVAKLKRGENPFNATAEQGAQMQFMRLACHILLRLKDGLSREVLTSALITKLGLSENTAKCYARIAIVALVHVGAVDNTDGLIRMRS